MKIQMLNDSPWPQALHEAHKRRKEETRFADTDGTEYRVGDCFAEAYELHLAHWSSEDARVAAWCEFRARWERRLALAQCVPAEPGPALQELAAQDKTSEVEELVAAILGHLGGRLQTAADGGYVVIREGGFTSRHSDVDALADYVSGLRGRETPSKRVRKKKASRTIAEVLADIANSPLIGRPSRGMFADDGMLERAFLLMRHHDESKLNALAAGLIAIEAQFAPEEGWHAGFDDGRKGFVLAEFMRHIYAVVGALRDHDEAKSEQLASRLVDKWHHRIVGLPQNGKANGPRATAATEAKRKRELAETLVSEAYQRDPELKTIKNHKLVLEVYKAWRAIEKPPSKEHIRRNLIRLHINKPLPPAADATPGNGGPP
jgi:hypothetical protein